MSLPSARLARLALACLPCVIALAGSATASAGAPLLPEREPNDDDAHAAALVAPARLEGTLTRGDSDVWILVVDDDAATGSLFDLRLEAPAAGVTTVTLTPSSAKAPLLSLATSASAPAADRRRLLLAPDTYRVVVKGAEGPYALAIDARPLKPLPLAAGGDRERAPRARPASDDTSFVLPAGDAWVRWAPPAGSYDLELSAVGDAPLDVALEGADGNTLAAAKGAGPRLTAVAVPRGETWLRVRGPEGTLVALRTARAGTPDGDAQPTPLLLGRTATGELAPRVDVAYRVHVGAGAGTYRVSARGAGVKGLLWSAPSGQRLLSARASGAGAATEAAFDHLVLLPGDHVFTLSGGPGPYALTVSPAPLPAGLGAAALEREPNDGGAFVDALRFGAPRAGFVTVANDGDHYRYSAPAETAGLLTITALGAPLRVRWTVGTSQAEAWVVKPGEPLVAKRRFRAGDHTLEVAPQRGEDIGAAYVIDLAPGDPFDPAFAAPGEPAPATAPATVAVTVTLAEETAAAWLDAGQTLRGEAAIVAKAPGTVALAAATGDPRWVVALEKTSVAVAAGKRVVVPLEVRVAPDAVGGRPVRVSVGARGDGGAWGSGSATAVAEPAALPVRPARVWALPDALLGGVDVARGAALVDSRGKPVTGPSARVLAAVSGVTRPDRPFVLPLAKGAAVEAMPTFALASGPARVAGVVLEAVGPDMATSVADFRVSLSMDGTTWREAVAARLEAREGLQSYVLGAPTDARFARLEIVSTHEGPLAAASRTATLGSFEVIAAPEAPVPGAPSPDLADPARGGHVVWTAPARGFGHYVDLQGDERAEVVVGFHHDRAARVTEIAWVDPPKGSGARLPGVTLYTATAGPLGPWTKVGKLAAPGKIALPAGTWARFVRLESEPAGGRLRAMAPGLVVREATAGPGYRSILGEWGPFSRAAAWEREHPAPAVAGATARGNQSRKTAAKLGAAAVSGRVHRGRVEDFWAVTVPAGHHQLTLDVSGSPTLDVDFEVSDARGAVLPPRQRAEKAGAARRTWEVTPGQALVVRVWQPPSSVVFSWDTSGSVASWVPLVRDAIARFAATVTPGQEQVHLLPFGGEPLLAGWETGADHLWSALSSYRPAASSEAAAAVRRASELLAETRGAKAVILLTDALTPPDTTLWRALDEVRPRVFAAGVAAGLEGEGQDRLEDWASVGPGRYDGVVSRGELDDFFERASATLRRPASYTLAATTRAEPLLAPGTLAVVDDGSGAAAAVELVVDVSGSMLETMRGGGTRVDVAKKIIADIVGTEVPARSTVAVRVFGRVGGDACATALVVPPGPKDAALAAIAGITATKYAMTPIAAALKAVGEDLAGTKGPKTVVLLTDGRETCGGDPLAATKELGEKGLDVRLNVVGFALSSARLKRTFGALAEAGGGQFYDAADGEGLAEVLAAAVRSPWVVADAAGAVVARGAVGGAPVSLPAGRYRVEVATVPPRVFEDVEVRDGEAKQLSLGDGK